MNLKCANHQKKAIAVVFTIFVIAAVIASLLRLFSQETPSPPPRNVKILVGGGGMIYYTLLEVNENYLHVTVISTSWILCDETGEFSIGRREPLDRALLDDFAESLSGPNLWSVLRRYDLPFGIIDSGSVELSEEQLHSIWQKIDNVVQNYEAHPGFYINPPLIRAVIDEEFYWIVFVFGNTLQNRRDRRLIDASIIDLAILTHYLVDLAPIEIWW